MNILPYTKIQFVVDTPLSNAHELIASRVGPKAFAKFVSSLSERNNDEKFESELQQLTVESELEKGYIFEGEVHETTFKIERKSDFKRHYVPMITGSLEKQPVGTKMTALIMLRPSMICFLILFITLSFYSFSQSPSSIKQFGIVATIISAIYFDFWFEVWFTKKKLLEIFVANRVLESK